MKLGLDGRLRRWPVRFGTAGPLESLEVDALDATPDGTAMATIREESGRDLVPTLVRVTPDGVATRLDGAGALAAMPDGGFLVNDSDNKRVRRVAPNGVISTVFGDGRFTLFADGSARRENASAITVDGSDVNSLHAAPEGGFYLIQVPVVGAGYLLRVDALGRMGNARFGTAGPRGADGSLARAEAVDVQADGSLVLVTSDHGGGHHVRVVAPFERMQRLAVSFTARDRRPVRRREVEVLATRSARARIDLFRGLRLLSAVDVDLHPGLNQIPVRIGRSGEVHVLRVRAADAGGAIAAHRLPVIPGPTLSRRALIRTLDVLANLRSDIDYAVVQRECRRRSARRFVCRTLEWNGRRYTRRGTGSIRLRADGWLELVERDRRGLHPMRWELEPER